METAMANMKHEYSGVLLGILEDLANMRQWLSFQDLCRMVSTRFKLHHLIELRSLLFAAASRDPCFPASLFRERVATTGEGLSPIGVAADIVTIFNLIQMTSGIFEGIQPMRVQTVLPVDQSPSPSLSEMDQMNFTGQEREHAHLDSGGRPIDQHLLFPKSNYSFRKRASLPPDPSSLVSSPPIRARAVSFDLPHTTLLYSSGQLPNEIMKTIYFPLDTDSESSGESASMEVFETEQGSSVDQKRNIFKKDFHNQPPLIPQVTVCSESPSPNKAKEGFDNRNFEVPNPYPSPILGHHLPDQGAKHESLNDLQDSTYFGPGATSESTPRHLRPPRSQRPIWSNKSHSLEDQISFGNIGKGMETHMGLLPRRSTPAINILGGSSGGESGDNGLPSGADGMKTQGTQTDPPDTRRLRSLVHADRLSFMTSLDDPDLCEDDISAIFRFLDDISMCGSTGVLHHNDGPTNPDTHEARRGRLGQLKRLFHSLESSDDGLQASVCRLLLRMSQIERQLESLNEVKAEISQVLSALQRLDEKIQQPVNVTGVPDTGGRCPSDVSEPQPMSGSGHLFPGTSTSSLNWSRWNTTGDQTENSKEVKEGKKDVSSCRSSKTLPDEKSISDSKHLNVPTSARDWTVSFSKDKDGKASQRKTEQSGSTTNLLSQKSTNLVEQVFNSSLFRNKERSLASRLTSGKVIDPRLAEGRGRPVWTVDDREARISPLDLQGQEILNPNNMEFWMDDCYTPGYDALLRRKQADLRRAKACKLLALIAIVVVIILIIVIPVCTMGLQKH
uniref:Major intrinsically disordered Notch2-binding receptor 1-like n=1 Tax=Gouania willdenowi TaxID=441366 RepID=A0A8C5EIT4_GOUWI